MIAIKACPGARCLQKLPWHLLVREKEGKKTCRGAGLAAAYTAEPLLPANVARLRWFVTSCDVHRHPHHRDVISFCKQGRVAPGSARRELGGVAWHGERESRDGG